MEEAPKPKTFGLVTVTYTRDNDIGPFMRYLNYVTSLKCNELAEINIIWNNEKTPE